MLATMFWLCPKSSLRVLFLFTMKEFVVLTPEVTSTITQVSSWSINDQSRVLQLSLTPSISHVEYVCQVGLSRLVIKSCWCVFVRSHLHLSLVHTLSHFSEVLTTGLPFDSRTITPPLIRSTVFQNSVEALSKSFQVAFPTSNLINLHAGHPESWT